MENILYNGIGEVCATCAVEGEVTGESVVALNAAGAAVPCAAGAAFVGVARQPRGGYTCVQFKGFACVSCTGGLTLGWNTLAADGKGGVKAADSGVKALVVKKIDDSHAVICL